MTSADIPISQLRKALCDNIHQLSTIDKQEVLNFALQQLPGNKFISSGDGTRISLDASIPDAVIIEMHNLIQSKMIFYDEADFKE